MRYDVDAIAQMEDERFPISANILYTIYYMYPESLAGNDSDFLRTHSFTHLYDYKD